MSIIFDNVYEDPTLELTLCQISNAKKALCVASGGCTALTLKTVYPDLQVDVADTNSDQIEFVKEKVELLESGNKSKIKQQFNIGAAHPNSFSNRAVYNKINQCLRLLIGELVADQQTLHSLFSMRPYPVKEAQQLFNNDFWNLVFQMVYSSNLVSVVLKKHVSHLLLRDKIGAFLRDNIRKGLCSSYAENNYILQRLFLGYYLPHALPAYLKSTIHNRYDFNYYHSSIDDAPNLETYDVISLSNICSWMNTEQLSQFAEKVASRVKPGAIILLRETSALRDPDKNAFSTNIFTPWFQIDEELGNQLLAIESSMLFDHIIVATRNKVNL